MISGHLSALYLLQPEEGLWPAPALPRRPGASQWPAMQPDRFCPLHPRFPGSACCQQDLARQVSVTLSGRQEQVKPGTFSRAQESKEHEPRKGKYEIDFFFKKK